MASISQAALPKPIARYTMAVAVVAAGFLLRLLLVQRLGLEMPTFITFYPAVFLVAILGGLWPGVLATALSALSVDLWVLRPVGSFGVERLSDGVALALFFAMGVFISLLAEYYRRGQQRIADLKAEQALWVSNAKLELALSSMADGVYISDTRGHFIQVNDALARFLRFKDKSELPKDIAEYRHFLEVFTAEGELLPPEMWSVPRALRGESATNLEFRLRRKDTGESWIASYNFAPFHDGNGVIIGAVVVARDITAQKRAEEAERERERDYRTLADAIPTLSWMANTDGWIFWYNRRWYEYTGTTAAQMEGWGWQSVHDPEVLPSVLDRWKGCIASGEPFEMIFPLRGADGAFRSFLTRVVPVRSADGAILRWFGINTDVTEQKLAEEALRKSETLYHGLFDSMDEGFCVIQMLFDPQGQPTDYTFLEVNAAFERQTGIHNAVGRTIRELAPSNEERWYQIYGNVALTGESISLPDASALNRHYEISAYRVGDPELRQVAIVFNDITEQKQAERHIRQLNRVYAVLSDINQTIVREKDSQAMLEAVCKIAVEKGQFRMAWVGLVSPTTSVLEQAASAGAIDGYLEHVKIELGNPKYAEGPTARAIATGKHALCNDIERDSHYMPWREEATRCGYRSSAAFPLMVDGKAAGVFNLYAAEPAFFDEDEVHLLDEVAMDISHALEVRRHEEERRHLEDNFRQAQKMEAVGQLTGGIAHDLNNLLTVILGCAEMLGDEMKENPRQGKMAEMISTAARQGAELTHRMLAFARRQALQPRPTDVIAQLKNMESILRRTLSATIDFEVIQKDENCEATVDPAQLESALLNLCVNARDAMPGGGRLTIETSCVELDANYAASNIEVTPGRYVLIAVSDTGCGIAPENLGRVFEPFFTTKEAGKGTGLGLSMVYGFIKQSSGHIKIYSEPGHGTTVKLYLPKALEMTAPNVELLEPAGDLRGTETILLAEDNAGVLEFARMQLEDLGYRVFTAGNGPEALNVLREHPEIDLLFTDMVMPGGMNGRQLALEAQRLHPNLRVLYCSGYARDAILYQELIDEDGQLLNKPYTRLDLARRIRGMFAEG